MKIVLDHDVSLTLLVDRSALIESKDGKVVGIVLLLSNGKDVEISGQAL